MKQFLLLISVIFSILFTGCDKSVDIEIPTPKILSFTTSDSQVVVLDSVILSCVVENQEGAFLSYEWNTSTGKINGSGASVLWIAPEIETTATIRVSVSNIRGAQDQKSLTITIFKNSPYHILVDASHDGGVWWFPQSERTGFSASMNHQGKPLADFLRNRGFIVDELPRGRLVTDSLLNQYNNVIRAGFFFDYTEKELQAYDAFLQRRTSLLLISEYVRPGEHDKLAERLGIQFTGIAYGNVNRFASHTITDSATSFYFNAGAVVMNVSTNPAIEILGWLDNSTYADLNNNRRQDVDEPTGPPVMGILHHPNAKIFFIGEINGFEDVPQPLTTNIFTWLFE